MPTLTVMGNIGAGKSTLLAAFEKRGTKVLYEPVEDWNIPMGMRAENDQSILQAYYAEPTRCGLAFQFNVLLSRFRQRDEIPPPGSKDLLVMERNCWSDYEIFGRTMRSMGQLSDADWYVYSQWVQELSGPNACVPDGIVYLRSSPLTCMERIGRRSRLGETSINLEYIELLHHAHEVFVRRMEDSGINVIVIDGDNMLADDSQVVARVLDWCSAVNW